MKIKIIDLLNKIANGEEVPKKIRLGNNPDIFYYKKDINSYKSCNGEYLISEWLFNSKRLNEEVEIIKEEKKIPRKLDHLIGYDIQQFDDLKEYVEITANDLFGKLNKVIDTLNYVIDYLKSKGE